jgi:hypothetical protein
MPALIKRPVREFRATILAAARKCRNLSACGLGIHHRRKDAHSAPEIKGGFTVNGIG